MKKNNLFTLHKIYFKFFKSRSSKNEEKIKAMATKNNSNVTVYNDVKNSVVNLVDFIKTVTTQNLTEASRNNIININESELESLVEITNASISQGMTTGFREIEGLITVLDKKITTSSKNTKSVKKK